MYYKNSLKVIYPELFLSITEKIRSAITAVESSPKNPMLFLNLCRLTS